MDSHGGTAGSRFAVSWLVTGIAAAVGVLLLGVVARLGPVARLSLRADQHIAAHDRTTGLTSLAKAFTAIGEPTVGVAALVLIPVILWLFRRRVDAVKALCLIGGTLALAEVGKLLINEPRPPLSLQAMAADHTPSFPSGHASTASAIAVAVIVVVAVGWRSRIAALVVGILYAVGVAVSRVYLGDHYPLDVVGGMLCAVAAAFVVTGLFRLPLVQPWLAKLGPRTR